MWPGMAHCLTNLASWLKTLGWLAKGTPTPMRVFLKDSVSAKGLSVEAISSLKRQAKTAVLSCNRQAAAEKATRKSSRYS